MISISSIFNKLYFSKYFVHAPCCIILLKTKLLVQDNFYKQQFKMIMYYSTDTKFDIINIAKLMQLLSITFRQQNDNRKNINTAKSYVGK